MARTFINLGLEQPSPNGGPSSPGIVVEGEPEAIIEKLSGRRDLVQLTSVNQDGSTTPVWVNTAYVRLVAEAPG
jgi:hypothetical protein